MFHPQCFARARSRCCGRLGSQVGTRFCSELGFRLGCLRWCPTVILQSVAVLVVSCFGTVWAGPINTNVALTPAQGVNFFRLQYQYAESDDGPFEHFSQSAAVATFVYGHREDLAFFLTVPYVNRQVDLLDDQDRRFEKTFDGLADMTFLLKYRFYQDDPAPLETTRAAVIVGMNVRSGDSSFSSQSYDPIIGAVYTWRWERHRFDADAIYQINTGSGFFRHDTIRYDVAWSYRVYPRDYSIDAPFEFGAVAELNGTYVADGSHEIYLAPGTQWVTGDWIIELSVQIPVVQELAGDRAEFDYRVIAGFRTQF
jgi:Putative MetA-pathway of phenol degradation